MTVKAAKSPHPTMLPSTMTASVSQSPSLSTMPSAPRAQLIGAMFAPAQIHICCSPVESLSASGMGSMLWTSTLSSDPAAVAMRAPWPSGVVGRIALSETKPKHRRDTAPATETLSRRTGGVNVTAEHAKIQHLFQSAAQRGVPSIGIADGRNEVGCGLIYDDTRIASVSNYGAYGVSAMLGFLLGDPDLVHDTDPHYPIPET